MWLQCSHTITNCTQKEILLAMAEHWPSLGALPEPWNEISLDNVCGTPPSIETHRINCTGPVVTGLDLSGSGINLPLIPEFFDFLSLTHLDLSGNFQSAPGTIPSALRMLESLEFLYVTIKLSVIPKNLHFKVL
jgi:hypothetical protein